MQWKTPAILVPLLIAGCASVLPPEKPDEEWIPGPKETPSDVSLGAIAPS